MKERAEIGKREKVKYFVQNYLNLQFKKLVEMWVENLKLR